MYYVETREAPIIAWCNLEAPKRLGRGSRNNTMEFVPKDAILVGGLLWCPNAKVGTTTMYYILKTNFGEFEHKDSWKKGRCYSNCPFSAWKLMKTANGRQKLLNATSFTIVRNPWDRIRSAYEDKIKTGKIRPKDGPADGIMTFMQFILYVEKHPHDNVHWMSYGERCSTSPNLEGHKKFHYDYIVRLENFDKDLEKVFAQANQKYHPGEKKNSHSAFITRTRADIYRELTANKSEYDLAIAKVGKLFRDDIVQFGYSFYDDG